jgi:hypothetical protein
MSVTKPENADYLAVVSEWSNYGKSGGLVGNAYPIFNLTDQILVEEPLEDFPNPGAVFLTNRGELKTWDYIRVRPARNYHYSNADLRNCYYIPSRMPQQINDPQALSGVAVLLDLPRFDPLTVHDTLQNPPQNVTPLFFIRTAAGRIFGPLCRTAVNRSGYESLETLGWGPGNDKNLLYEFTHDELQRKGFKLLNYTHPQPHLNEVLQIPIHLVVGNIPAAASDHAYDLLPDAQLAEWYLRLRQLPEVPPEVLKTLRSAAEQMAGTEPEIIRRRYLRLTNIFSRLEVFQTEQAALAHRYLESGEGRTALEQSLAQEVERRATEIEQEVRQRQKDLAEEKERLERQREELQEHFKQQTRDLDTEVRRLEKERTKLQAENQSLQADLCAGVDQLGSKLRQEVPLLAALASGLRPGPATEQAAPVPSRNGSPAAAEPIRPAQPTSKLEDLKDEAALVDRLVAALASEKLRFTRDFVANLYTTLKASPLNLIIGPPGHGKSSVVSALSRALGHGQALLEIPVRRSWSDDRYLLGFYDAFHGRYDPGPTGLVGRLLQAQRDWEESGQGLYLILLDEFNLAAPEYYFSQLLQISTRDQEPRLLQLFDPTALAGAESAYPPQIRLHPNVRFWGTINYDETTERLSPRLLDRTGMIFLGAQDVLLSAAVPLPAFQAASRSGIRARDLLGKFCRSEDDCPDDRWELIQPLLELLRQQRESWGPGIDLSPRVLKGIQRYLANSAAVLDVRAGVDFAFQQRVLPVLRGRGPGFTERIKAVHEKLAAAGLTRSIRHVAAALSRAEQYFGDVDFLAYG